MRADFGEKVALRYGLHTSRPPKRYGPAYRQKAAEAVTAHLKHHPYRLKEPAILDMLRDVFAETSNIAGVLEVLGLKDRHSLTIKG